MPTLFEWSLGVLAVYWAIILWRRWDTHARTQRFVLDQRRKAGIPDSDHRPIAEAAADAQRRRQEALAAQLQQTEDVFRLPSHTVNLPTSGSARRRRAEAETVQYNLPTTMLITSSPALPPRPRAAPHVAPRAKRPHEEGSEQKAKRERVERLERHDSLKRHADAPDDRRVRRRVTFVPDEDESSESEMSDETVEDVPDESEPSDASMEEDEEEDLGPSPSRKRAADTSDDHQPGDEWEDANGLRWRIGEDGVPRRAVTVVEMRPKYRMPRDAQHPDARLRVPTYTEKYLSHEEYEEAKRKKVLSWQYERARLAATTSSLPEADESVEDSLASLVSRRRGRRGHPDQLPESPRRHDEVPDESQVSVPGSDDSLSFSSMSAVDRSPAIGASRRLRLSQRTASPAPGGLLAQRYAQAYNSSPARSALDNETKRHREETLMAKVREQRKKAVQGDGAVPSKLTFSK